MFHRIYNLCNILLFPHSHFIMCSCTNALIMASRQFFWQAFKSLHPIPCFLNLASRSIPPIRRLSEQSVHYPLIHHIFLFPPIISLHALLSCCLQALQTVPHHQVNPRLSHSVWELQASVSYDSQALPLPCSPSCISPQQE